jgi:hypothetical protein
MEHFPNKRKRLKKGNVVIYQWNIFLTIQWIVGLVMYLPFLNVCHRVNAARRFTVNNRRFQPAEKHPAKLNPFRGCPIDRAFCGQPLKGLRWLCVRYRRFSIY